MNTAARCIIPALLSAHVARIAYPSAEAIARRVRIGCRYNPRPHEHRDTHTGAYMATATFNRAAYRKAKNDPGRTR